jgi:hypothetical protein
MSYRTKDWNGHAIRIDANSYVCLTDIGNACGKTFSNWYRLASAKSFLENTEHQSGVKLSELIITKEGGIASQQGTWAHPIVANEFQRWCSVHLAKKRSLAFESNVRDKLAEALGGETEVPCKTGAIDILTETEVIEVKKIKHWKAAIGQALVYSLEFPHHAPRIHLFGQASDEYRTMIVSFCYQLHVLVTFE